MERSKQDPDMGGMQSVGAATRSKTAASDSRIADAGSDTDDTHCPSLDAESQLWLELAGWRLVAVLCKCL